MAEVPNILVIGSINMDLVVRSAHMPAPGETVLGDSFASSPGGKGANQAVAAARLGAECHMIARVGDDHFGDALLENLRQAHVQTDFVAVSAGQPSGVAIIVVDAKGENAIVVASGANWRVTPDDVFGHEQAFAAADVVVLQLELPLPTVQAAIRVARKHACQIILDPAPARADLPVELFDVDVLTPNESESEIITGQPMPNIHAAKSVATELVSRGARNVVLKLGSAGSLVVTQQQQIHHAPPYKINVVDTTAAGDAFTAALAVAMGSGQGLVAAAQFANAAGALAASKFGAQSAMPTIEEVRILMADQPF